jgi:hypothetical protein
MLLHSGAKDSCASLKGERQICTQKKTVAKKKEHKQQKGHYGVVVIRAVKNCE